MSRIVIIIKVIGKIFLTYEKSLLNQYRKFLVHKLQLNTLTSLELKKEIFSTLKTRNNSI